MELLAKINEMKMSDQHEGRVNDSLQTCGDVGGGGGPGGSGGDRMSPQI